MAGTSLNLAALNLTQVERLGGKTKVYILAILKTSSDKPYPIDPLGEITYPLGVGFNSNGYVQSRAPVPKANDNSRSPQDMESPHTTDAITPVDYASAQYSQHPPAGQAVETAQQYSIPQADGAEDDAVPAAALAQQPPPIEGNRRPVLREPATESSIQSPALTQDTAASTRKEKQRSMALTGRNERPRETFSDRDSRATRTFAILKMLQPGDNPWDLGSARLNLESVMGTSIFDWLSPVRRSPCCNHESTESQFPVGPKVAFLRASMDPNQPAHHSSLNEPTERAQ
jgi:palmitoyltransferase